MFTYKYEIWYVDSHTCIDYLHISFDGDHQMKLEIASDQMCPDLANISEQCMEYETVPLGPSIKGAMPLFQWPISPAPKNV